MPTVATSPFTRLSTPETHQTSKANNRLNDVGKSGAGAVQSSTHLNAGISRMAILCFGGTFNPIHHGHLLCARAAAERLGYTKVLIIPSAIPPLRSAESGMALAVHRLRMCQIAVERDPFFDVSDVELLRSEPSYTVETVRTLKARGAGQVAWLIGGDSVANLPRWHEARQLLREAQLVVMARPGWEVPWDTLPIEFRSLRDHVVPAPLVEISATEVRRRVQAGLSIEFLVPPAVADYIRTQRLYGGG